jgi:hypothetical protein
MRRVHAAFFADALHQKGFGMRRNAGREGGHGRATDDTENTVFHGRLLKRGDCRRLTLF